MERNLAVWTYRPRDTSLLDLSDEADQEVILDRWQFQEILKELASRLKAQENPLAKA